MERLTLCGGKLVSDGSPALREEKVAASHTRSGCGLLWGCGNRT